MRFKLSLLILFFAHCHSIEASGFWSFSWLDPLFHVFSSKSNAAVINLAETANSTNNFKRAANEDDLGFWENGDIPPHCEDSVLVPLAKLKIVSPEKIIELITTNNLEHTCVRVNDTVVQVQKAIDACTGFPLDHLYKKLADGLEHFASLICSDVTGIKGNDDAADEKRDTAKSRLIDYRECLNQLQDELFDCEGPADWFEKRNSTIACQFYNDIIDCNYIKAAMLCGKPAARLLRDFSDSIMRKVLNFRCKKSRALPHVDNPMIDNSAYLKSLKLFLLIGMVLLPVLF